MNPPKEFTLSIHIDIRETQYSGSGLRVDEDLQITATGFLDLARVLVRFHDLAVTLREEQAKMGKA